ncbi:MAG: signal peptidase I [Actinobacteria bacterium]|nr:signal peptidase I [Actinomycetota bacterium]
MKIGRLTAGLPRPWRVVIDWLVTIVVAIGIVLGVKAWIVNPYRIPSGSMESTLHCAKPALDCEARFSDRVLACRICLRFSEPHRGDIIVFHTPPLAAKSCGSGGTFVKRLVGLPGEIWSERAGYVFINARRLREGYIQPEHRDAGTLPPRRIAAGHYFMMGDDRSGSCDSRKWGTVARGEMIGRVIATYWPPTRLTVR